MTTAREIASELGWRIGFAELQETSARTRLKAQMDADQETNSLILTRDFMLAEIDRLSEAKLLVQVVERSGGGIVDVLGNLLDRLPDTLGVDEVLAVLDRLDVVLGAHESSSRVGPSAAVTADGFTPILEDATDGRPSRRPSVAPSTGGSL
jgi:hypothetical protein